MSASPTSIQSPLSSVPLNVEIPVGYHVISTGREYAVTEDDCHGHWPVVKSGFEDKLDAIFWAQERAEAIEEEERLAAEAEAEEAAENLAQSVADLLYALDRGHLGTNALRFGDGSECAFITDLRAKLAAYEAA